MIYTSMTKKAMKICFEAHKEQTDKTGLPYVFHPFHLAEQMTDEITTTVALLHDVVEDTSATFEDLKNAGFPEEVLRPLRLLTHDPRVPYLDYIRCIKTDPVAKAVKSADLAHNSDITRYDSPDNCPPERSEKYLKAIRILNE